MNEFAIFTIIAMTPSDEKRTLTSPVNMSTRGRLTRFVPKSGVLNLKIKTCIWMQRKFFGNQSLNEK